MFAFYSGLGHLVDGYSTSKATTIVGSRAETNSDVPDMITR